MAQLQRKIMKTFEEYKASRNTLLTTTDKTNRSIHTPKDYKSKMPKNETLCALCGKQLYINNPDTDGKQITRKYYHMNYPGTPLELSLCYRADVCYNSYKARHESNNQMKGE